MRWTCRDRPVEIGARPLVMGILNVTPDSFSDGGRFLAFERAVRHGLAMREQGADIIDVGGESTRPGAQRVDAATELARVVPVIEALSGRSDALISVDTRKAEVAEQALRCGAHIVNDVSALTADAAMAEVAGRYRAGVVLMHMRGEPATMQQAPHYEDVVREVAAYLRARLDDAVRRGLDCEALVVDPGIGFGKTLEHNLALLAQLEELRALGRPVLVGLSRKSFLGALTGRDVADRLLPSLTALAWCVLNGAAILRVHDVKESCEAVRLLTTLQEGCSRRPRRGGETHAAVPEEP